MKMKWFIRWNPELKFYEVVCGGFCDSPHENKQDARNRRDLLNALYELEEE